MFTVARNLLVDALRRVQVDTAARKRLGLERIAVTDDDLERIETLMSQFSGPRFD